MMGRTTLASCVTVVAVFTSARALADDKADCTAAYSSAQDLRAGGQLIEASEQLKVCARPVCPTFIAHDCTQWVAEVDASTPTLVLSAKDGNGHDVIDVRVWIDGQLVTEKLDGKPIPIDPGAHDIRFQMENAPGVRQKVLARTGEKNRAVEVTFDSGEAPSKQHPPEATKTEQRPPSEPTSTHPTPEPPATFKHFWIGVSGSFEATFIPSSSAVCKLSPTGLIISGYYCTTGNSSQADFQPSQAENSDIIATTQSDEVSGGPVFGNIRVLATFDYAINANFLIGVRAGYAGPIGYGGTRASQEGHYILPFEFELRGLYVTGAGVMGAGAHGYVTLGVGVAPFTGSVSTTVNFAPGTFQSGTFDAWALGGPGFVELGGGLRYAFVEQFAMLFGPRVAVAFGSGPVLPSIGFEVGAQFGL
jgi:hypothetical protein